jgi:hypothetical protein
VLLCHLSEAVAAPLSLPRRSEAKAGRGDSPKTGDSERIREQAPRRGYSAIQYFNRLLGPAAKGSWLPGVLPEKRNTELQSVRPAEFYSAESNTPDRMSGGRTGHSPVFHLGSTPANLDKHPDQPFQLIAQATNDVWARGTPRSQLSSKTVTSSAPAAALASPIFGRVPRPASAASRVG